MLHQTTCHLYLLLPQLYLKLINQFQVQKYFCDDIRTSLLLHQNYDKLSNVELLISYVIYQYHLLNFLRMLKYQIQQSQILSTPKIRKFHQKHLLVHQYQLENHCY